MLGGEYILDQNGIEIFKSYDEFELKKFYEKAEKNAEKYKSDLFNVKYHKNVLLKTIEESYEEAIKVNDLNNQIYKKAKLISNNKNKIQMIETEQIEKIKINCNNKAEDNLNHVLISENDYEMGEINSTTCESFKISIKLNVEKTENIILYKGDDFMNTLHSGIFKLDDMHNIFKLLNDISINYITIKEILTQKLHKYDIFIHCDVDNKILDNYKTIDFVDKKINENINIDSNLLNDKNEDLFEKISSKSLPTENNSMIEYLNLGKICKDKRNLNGFYSNKLVCYAKPNEYKNDEILETHYSTNKYGKSNHVWSDWGFKNNFKKQKCEEEEELNHDFLFGK